VNLTLKIVRHLLAVGGHALVKRAPFDAGARHQVANALFVIGHPLGG